MKHVLAVCLIALTFAAVVPCASAQSPELRKGISVRMAVTRNASPMPEADAEDAWVVTVAADGRLYFGADPMAPDQLADWMKTHPRNREANLYIKADARASFANVEKVLEIGRAMGFETPVLLTTQAERVAPGTMVSPKGLPVLLEVPPGTSSIVVEIGSGEGSSSLKVNNDEISSDSLPSTLSRLLQNQNPRVVTVKADGRVPFNDFARVIDLCSSIGAKVSLLTAAEL